MNLDIEWKNDCQGKKDYDGSVVHINCRYYPDYATVFDSENPEKGLHCIKNKNHSATCKVIISDGHEGKYLVIAEESFTGDSFDCIKEKVEDWASEKVEKISTVLIKTFDCSLWTSGD